MPTPKEGYFTNDGKRVPGVTTVIGRFKSSDGIIRWSNNIAREPLMQAYRLARADNLKGTTECLNFLLDSDPDTWDNKKTAARAADAGSCAHEMFDCEIRGVKFQQEKYPEAVKLVATPAYTAAVEWAEQSKLEIVETEQALVSEQYRFGGTRDAILVSGKRAIGDWKTSNSIYPEMLCQLAAYGQLDEEAGNVIDGGFHLLKFSKQEKPDDPVKFTHHYWSHLDRARDAFLLMRELYETMKDVERYAK